MTEVMTCTQQPLTEQLAEAASCLNAFWPMTTFIACNPLKGFEGMPFEEAMAQSSRLFGTKGFLPLAEYRQMYESGRIAPADLQEAFARHAAEKKAHEVPASAQRAVKTWAAHLDKAHRLNLVAKVNRQAAKWCGAYLDTNQSQWSMDTTGGLYAAWKRLAQFDMTFDVNGCAAMRSEVAQLPSESTVALSKLLEKIGVSSSDTTSYLRAHLTEMPGWASHLLWRQSEPSLLMDYVVIRLFYEAAFCEAAARKLVGQTSWARLQMLDDSRGADHPLLSTISDYAPVWQDAYEINYRNRLLSQIGEKSLPARTGPHLPDAQLVFCIDVRSEPLRRKLESLGSYETYGFAGFFGFAMRLREFGSATSLDLCPVLIKPQKEVEETADGGRSTRLLQAQALSAAAAQLRKKLKSSLGGAFGLVESIGLMSSIPLLGKTFLPAGFHSGCRAFWEALSGKRQVVTELCTDAFSLEEKVALAKANLHAIGIAKRLAPVVVLVGHKAQTVNNPYASALDCGACGGNGGAYSARLAAQIFNDPEVRAELAKAGEVIPEDTIFIAAVHNTTTDSVELFGASECEFNAEIVAQLKSDLAAAGKAVQAERIKRLPKPALSLFNKVEERASDWAQVAPEWGLARNAAFIAAPRDLTRGINLEGRTFLHSYNCENDPESSILELIMTAPMVVAQWINAQYYMSTVDNSAFGSGTKVLHNVIGDFGVALGSGSDLRIGLPQQSVMANEHKREHEPMRLLAVLRAPMTQIDRILAKHKPVADLVDNRWIRLVAIDPLDGSFWQCEGRRAWKRIPAPGVVQPVNAGEACIEAR